MSDKKRKDRVLMGTQVAAGVAAIVAAAYGAHDVTHPDQQPESDRATPNQYHYTAGGAAESRYVAVKPVADIKVKGGPGASKTSVSVGPPIVVGGAGGKDKKQGGS